MQVNSLQGEINPSIIIINDMKMILMISIHKVTLYIL